MSGSMEWKGKDMSSQQVWDVGKDIPSRIPVPSRISFHDEQLNTDEIRLQFAKRFLSDAGPQLQDQIVSALSQFSIGSNGRTNAPLKSLYHVNESIYMHVSLKNEESALGTQFLKSDFFHGLHKLPDPPLLKGSFNFRKVRLPDLGIYGVSQPSLQGIRNIINHLLNTGEYERIFWINMREEPIVLIKGQPFSPRERETLNINLDYLIGIAAYNLASIEERLRADIISIALQNNNKIEYFHQNSEMENELITVQVDSSEIRTLKSVYQALFSEGMPVNYCRVPVTDECAPGPEDFEDFVDLFRDGGHKTCFVFNCQMGRGRTTTGMVCATLYVLIREYDFCRDGTQFCRQSSHWSRQHTEESFLNGNYKAVVDLVQAFYCHDIEQGLKLKKIVDDAIDACDHIQNIREAIYECKKISENPESCDDNRPPEYWRKRGLNYLERYAMIIVFAQYLKEQIPHRFSLSYSAWLKQHWGIKRLLRNMTLD